MKILHKNSPMCDFYGCKNKAVFSFKRSGPFGAKNVHLCKECMQTIYAQLSKYFVPKAVENPLKRPKKLKEK